MFDGFFIDSMAIPGWPLRFDGHVCRYEAMKEMRPHGSADSASGVTRRRFLRLAGAALLSVLPSRLLWGADTAVAGQLTGWRWSDPQTWGGRVPGPRDVAVISKKVILDVNAQVAGVIVKPGAQLVYHPRRSVTLRSTGNVVIRGRLAMRPETPSPVHRLIFLNVKENRFTGGGMNVLASDVGLWVMHHGTLDIAGSPKLAWTRVAIPVPAGATTIELAEDPIGWRVGDRLAITPTLPPSIQKHHEAYDYAAVAAISGRTITLSRATVYQHPEVDVGRGQIMRAEVLNFTRNVQIQGTSRGRAHVFIHSMHSQRVKNAALRYLGPRRPDPKRPAYTVPILGRYGLHFHHCKDGSRGSLVEGVVGRDIGSHVFVPHTSHGVTFRDCISHNTLEDAYWWDNRADPDSIAPATHDTVYARCVASRVRSDPAFEGYTLSGFALGRGKGNVCQDSISTGILGNVDSSGFKWPEGSEGVWLFERCTSHNNFVHGLWVWQVTSKVHPITNFVGYHNGGSGILHGAYDNNYQYRDSILYGNGRAQIFCWAASRGTLLFENLLCDGAGLSDYALVLAGRAIAPDRPTGRVVGCSFKGYRKAAVNCTFDFHDYGPNRTLWDLIGCDYGLGNQFWVSDTIHETTKLNVQDSILGTMTLLRSDQTGELRPEWNARVEVL
jgi:hypothetical protein